MLVNWSVGADTRYNDVVHAVVVLAAVLVLA